MMNYKQGVKKGIKIVNDMADLEARINHYRLILAEVAYRVCKPKCKTQGYSSFAREVGCCEDTLFTYVKIYRNAYLKSNITKQGMLHPSKLKPEERSAVVSAGIALKQDASQKEVNQRIEYELNLPSRERSFRSYVIQLGHINNFFKKNNIKELDRDNRKIAKKLIREINKVINPL